MKSLQISRVLRGAARGAALFIVAAAAVAHAEDIAPPTASLLTAPLVSPGAVSYASTAHTTGVNLASTPSPELTALARSLVGGRNLAVPADRDAFVLNVRDYVRNNIGVEFRYGLGKGARGALIDQYGTPFDQAELMVALLRAGYLVSNSSADAAGATLVFGDMTLNAQQFGLWTGLVKSLNEANQTFSVSARSACRLLADGGIPATVNGASSCDGLSGDLTAVTVSHIWVQVNGGSYDPSYKIHRLRAGIDIPAAMGCGTKTASTCGADVRTAGMVGASTGTTAQGANYLDAFNYDGMMAKRATQLTSLGAAVKAKDIGASAVDIVGGKEMIVQEAIAAPSYTVRGSWTSVPDTFRTVISMDTVSGYCVAFYSDEIAGRSVTFGPTYRVDDKYIIDLNYVAAPGAVCPTLSATASRAYTAIRVDHPYPAQGGSYGDETVQFKPIDPPHNEVGIYRSYDPENEIYGSYDVTTHRPSDFPETAYLGSWPLTIVHNLGQAKSSAIKSATDRANVAPFRNENACRPTTNSEIASRTCGGESQPIAAETVNVYRTFADTLIDGVNGVVTTRHHDIGIVYASRTPELSLVTLQEGLSVNAKADSETDRTAGYEAQAMLLSEVEAIASPSGAGRPRSALGYFASEFRWGTTANSPFYSRRVYQIPQDKMAGFLGTVPDQYSVDNADGTKTFGLTCISGTNCWRKSQLQDVASKGYSTIMLEGGSSELFYKGVGERSYTMWEYSKGGVMVSDPLAPALKTTEIIDLAAERRKWLGVSPAAGGVSFQTAPDLVAGAGDFPLSLPFIRTFSPTYRERAKTISTVYRKYTSNQMGGGYFASDVFRLLKSGGDAQYHDRLGGGWMHNYQIHLMTTNDPSAALGGEYVLFANGVIGALQVSRDLSASWDLGSRTTSMLSFSGFLVYHGYNAVTVANGPKSTMFHCCVDGRFYSHQDPSATVVNNGNGTWRYTGAGGDTIDFSLYERTAQEYNIQTGDLYADSPFNRDNVSIFKADSWSFPNGVKLKFEYNYRLFSPPGTMTWFMCGGVCQTRNTLPAGYVLWRVSNNLGRSLTFSSSAFNAAGGGQYGYGINTVTDDSGRVVSFDRGGCATYTCDYFSVTSPELKVTRYEYTGGSDSPDPATIGKPDYQLRRWRTAGNPGSAYQTIAYDEIFRAKTLKDANGGIVAYYPGGIYGVEEWQKSEVLDAMGVRSKQVFNDKSSLVETVDGLQRRSRSAYDRVGRVIRTDDPGGLAVEKSYDVRGNLVSTCTIPVQTDPAQAGRGCDKTKGDIVTATAYYEPAGRHTCVDAVLCNKPTSDTDAKDLVTSYAWYSYGELKEILRPADSDSKQPRIKATYSDFAGTDGTFKLLTSKEERVSDSADLTTDYAYDIANKFVLKSVTVDPGGVAATTCLKFDKAGNLVAQTDPRGGACQ